MTADADDRGRAVIVDVYEWCTDNATLIADSLTPPIVLPPGSHIDYREGDGKWMEGAAAVLFWQGANGAGPQVMTARGKWLGLDDGHALVIGPPPGRPPTDAPLSPPAKAAALTQILAAHDGDDRCGCLANAVLSLATDGPAATDDVIVALCDCIAGRCGESANRTRSAE